MFQWYRDSNICYAYIEDVSEALDKRKAQNFNETLSTWDRPDVNIDTHARKHFESNPSRISQHADRHTLENSRWFTRGWTLQELVAPKHLKFYNREWRSIGPKESLADAIFNITKIPADVLLNLRRPRDCSIAKRMSWAAWRETSRTEDMTYCLMGIFEIQMPLLYGEGDNAFVRLQKEFIARSTDQSIFAWEDESAEGVDFLAHSPKSFANSGSYETMPRSIAGSSYYISHRGLEVTTGILYDRETWEIFAILDAFDSQRCDRRLVLKLDPVNKWHPNRATEYSIKPRTIRLICSADMVLSERLKVVRSITILNQATHRFDSTIDLRVRCFIDGGLDWPAVGAGPLENSEEVSFTMLRCSPPGCWDPGRSMLTLHESDLPHSPAACTFAAKLCYTPRKRSTLGKFRSEVMLMAKISFNLHGSLVACFKLGPSQYPPDLDFQADYHNLCQTMSFMEPRQHYGVWEIGLLCIEPSVNDPYRTLALAAAPLISSGRRVGQAVAVLSACKSLPSFLPLMLSRFRHRQRLVYNVKYGIKEHRDTPAGYTIPRTDLKDLYGSRKRWREAKRPFDYYRQ